ncbi:hypothetical protein [Dyella flagellata]|uniref:Pertussis toxin, subunit 1 n=1 Tax=Dyella flagellata TaxID=1867833 RepID=A0ABQ5X7H0_9GAMM|nr:hypothetical protein [Dyella flagellata]GLQ87554.1 hypothetical protein GCM10007898_11200 [Dyella flagellata]
MNFRSVAKLCRTLLAALLLIATVIAYAEPPGLLYRADVRAPDGESGIFRTGFVSWGNNQDLKAHQLGYSCGTGDQVAWGSADSAYVSLANSLERAREFADRSFEPPRPDVWIYTVRATPTFYDAAATVTNAMRSQDQAIRNSAYQVNYLQGVAIAAEGEYISLGGIDRSLIRDATRYRWNESGMRYEEVQGSRLESVHFVPDTESRANAGPIDPRIAFAGIMQPAQVNRYVSMGLSIFGVCACLSKSGAFSTRADQVSGGNTYCHPRLQDRNATSMVNLHLFN